MYYTSCYDILMPRLEDRNYRALADWRHALRRFLAASEAITRAQGFPRPSTSCSSSSEAPPDGAPAIEDLAGRLQIRHQSAVGLVDRCERPGSCGGAATRRTAGASSSR